MSAPPKAAPPSRLLIVEVLEVDRHVPSELRVRLIERPATGPVDTVGEGTDADAEGASDGADAAAGEPDEPVGRGLVIGGRLDQEASLGRRMFLHT